METMVSGEHLGNQIKNYEHKFENKNAFKGTFERWFLTYHSNTSIVAAWFWCALQSSLFPSRISSTFFLKKDNMLCCKMHFKLYLISILHYTQVSSSKSSFKRFEAKTPTHFEDVLLSQETCQNKTLSAPFRVQK